MDNNICRTFMKIVAQANNIVSNLSAYLSDLEEEDDFDGEPLACGLFALSDTMRLLTVMETHIGINEYKNTMFAFVVKDIILPAIKEGADLVEKIAEEKPLNTIFPEAVQTARAFYKEHTTKWVGITKDWNELVWTSSEIPDDNHLV
jgi:hypothetical protein